ncbi:glycosyltransferase family 4 protein [Fulvimarina sp. 2208YS6-2-32]|uniref:Glycosyltransferase family 4 protein n=1 Tax=Fulvimarina uroteuthidis TaxID=3098149 RepID=A0ABU5HYL6_9HYPH|nr:glycosyltransferase family 4 protein [Fulvimarina sp. 2208YS6-2-32]MDY8108155.1 glycosyltransferase family 4 protein [Fulvimarina sp. 2208YS6-2-32]
MKTLRVAQLAPNIVPTPPDTSGGTERIVHDLSEALESLGVSVTLFAPSDSRSPIARIGDLPSLKALEAEHGHVPPSIPQVLEAVQMEALRKRLDLFDIVHCHGEFFHAALLGERRKHSLTTIHWRVDELDRKLFFEAFPDLPVAAISRSQWEQIPTANRAGIVHHGLAQERYALRSGEGGFAVFIGRMTDQKQPDAAIRIARAAGLPIRLAGAIDVGNPTYFDRNVRPLLADDAVFVGPKDDHEKQHLIGAARALLFPIDWPEPFGLVMIEAMACGTPVIAFDRGSVPEIVEDGVTGFVVKDEAEAVEALKRVGRLDRSVIRKRFEDRFTARRMAQDYLALYRRLRSQ